jgi:two-component system NtrC family response regulator
VGGKQEIKSDFRLIAASNRNLDEMVRQKQFREDLLFRLRSFSIELTPLRDRREDIKDLVTHYMSELSERYGIEPKEFSPELLDLLLRYPWPGNVRELINTLEKTMISARYERVIFPKHLPTHIRIQVVRSSIREKDKDEIAGAQSPRVFPNIQELRERVIEEAEKKYLQDLLSFTHNDIKEACRISGLSRSRLYLLLKKHKIFRSIPS